MLKSGDNGGKDDRKMCMYYIHTILAGRSLPFSRAPSGPL